MYQQHKQCKSLRLHLMKSSLKGMVCSVKIEGWKNRQRDN